MADMQETRRVVAHFATSFAAREAAEELRALFEVEGPRMTKPVNGRPFEIVVVLPETLSPLTMYPDPHLLSRINQVVMRFDGVTMSTTP